MNDDRHLNCEKSEFLKPRNTSRSNKFTTLPSSDDSNLSESFHRTPSSISRNEGSDESLSYSHKKKHTNEINEKDSKRNEMTKPNNKRYIECSIQEFTGKNDDENLNFKRLPHGMKFLKKHKRSPKRDSSPKRFLKNVKHFKSNSDIEGGNDNKSNLYDDNSDYNSNNSNIWNKKIPKIAKNDFTVGEKCEKSSLNKKKQKKDELQNKNRVNSNRKHSCHSENVAEQKKNCKFKTKRVSGSSSGEISDEQEEIVPKDFQNVQPPKEEASVTENPQESECQILDINRIILPIPVEKSFQVKKKEFSEYPPVFQACDDIDMTSSIKEIDEMLNKMQINDAYKQTVKARNNSAIQVVCNLKEDYFNPSYLSFQLNSIHLSSLLRKYEHRKLNLILDIDSTMIYADQVDNPLVGEYKISDREDLHYINPTINGNTFNLRLKIRKCLFDFLQRTRSFCNYFISTHSQETYAKEVLKIISDKAGIEVKDENISAQKQTGLVPPIKTLSTFSQGKNFHNMALIFDDNAKAWANEYYDNIILSMRYQAFFNNIFFDDKQCKQLEGQTKYFYCYLMKFSRLQEICDFSTNFVDENNSPFSLEYDHSTKYQLMHMADLIENVYKLSILEKSKRL